MTSRGFVATIVTFLLGLGVALAGCGQDPSSEPAGQTPDATASQTTPPPSDSTPEGASGSSPAAPSGEGPVGAPDGGEDPEQNRVRTGPVASFGGPAYGDQGVEEISPGTWCDTIAVFWGGDAAVPAGVRFTFERAVTDPPSGLEVRSGVCGTQGADRSCIGLTLDHNDNATCSMVLRPTRDFVEGTTVRFIGTLTCPTRAVCDQVAARSVTPGPPIVVTTPSGGSSPEGGESPGTDASPREEVSAGAGPSPESGTTPGEESSEGGTSSTGGTSSGAASSPDTRTSGEE